MPSEPIKEFIEMDVFMGHEPHARHAGIASRYFLPTFTSVTGAATAMMMNLVRMRPLWAGLQMYAVFIAAGGAIGEGVYQFKEWKNARRDAMYKHYIELHPEHFINDERPKYKEVFEPWIPIR